MSKINKILFPTNCSKNSKEAFRYTLAFAQYFGASIEVLHVCEHPVDLLVPSIMRFKLIQEEKRNGEKRLDLWLKEFEDSNQLIHREVELGIAKETIAIYANKREDIDLIAIGTNDSHSLTKIFWGTIISQIVESANAPVLVIPKGIQFQEIHNVAYVAPDTRNWHAVYPQVKQLTKDFDAKLFITHLAQAKFGEIEGEEHVVLDDYGTALYTFAYNANLHLLVTMASRSSVRKKLEGMFRYSKTQKMAMVATIPLLVLQSATQD